MVETAGNLEIERKKKIKSMRMLFFLSVVVLLITNMISFFSCSPHSVIEDAYIEGVEISISETRPAQVVVTATAFYRNTCVSGLEIHQKRSGNTISLSGEMEIIDIAGMDCGDMITDIQEQISIGEFTVGEYKVIADDLEAVFHIEDDESWVIGNPLIEDVEVLVSESAPAQVVVNVEGYVWKGCMPFLKTRQKQEGDTTYIQITGKVPGDVRCPVVINRDVLFDGMIRYQNEISIGEFTLGHYRVIVGNIERWFLIE